MTPDFPLSGLLLLYQLEQLQHPQRYHWQLQIELVSPECWTPFRDSEISAFCISARKREGIRSCHPLLAFGWPGRLGLFFEVSLRNARRLFCYCIVAIY